MGTRGSSLAITSYLLREEHEPNHPAQIIVSNRSTPRLEGMENIH